MKRPVQSSKCFVIILQSFLLPILRGTGFPNSWLIRHQKSTISFFAYRGRQRHNTKTHLIRKRLIPDISSSFSRRRIVDYESTALFAGSGIAQSYRWKEQPSELEVFVEVPTNTRAKNIKFKCSPTSIDLRLVLDSDKEETILLSGDRTLRGKICMDGTFWSIADKEYDEPTKGPGRIITVIMEKNVRVGEFEVQTDWEGVFVDDEEEIIERNYVEPEELDVRDYCKRELGVDIDNIDMSKVDKSMFSSLNMTSGMVDDLKKGNFVREVTKQGDLEFVVEENDSEDGVIKKKEYKGEGGIPFVTNDFTTTNIENIHSISENGSTENTSSSSSTAANSSITPETDINFKGDPVDQLTVSRLKEILRSKNLKVSGTKQELQKRLKEHIQSIMDEMNRESET